MPSARANEDSFTRRFFKNDLTHSGGQAHRKEVHAEDNRRRHPRFTLDGHRITCYKGSVLAKLGFKKNIAHSVQDVSAVGMRIRTLEPLSLNSSVSLELTLEQFSDSLTARGVVRWIKPLLAANGARYYDIGVEFTGHDERRVKKIKAMESWFTSPQRAVKGKS